LFLQNLYLEKDLNQTTNRFPSIITKHLEIIREELISQKIN